MVTDLDAALLEARADELGVVEVVLHNRHHLVQRFGFRVWGSGFGVWGLEFGVQGVGFMVWGLWFSVWRLGLGV